MLPKSAPSTNGTGDGAAKIYTGRRSKQGTCVVRVIEGGDARRLRPRTDLANHSPTGFEWGYAGSGPAQLSLALLADALDDDQLALSLHQRFKRMVVASLPRDKDAIWQMTTDYIITMAMICSQPTRSD